MLAIESSEAFVVSGPKSCRLPALLPGSSTDIRFHVVALSCGLCRLPTFKVLERRLTSVRQPTTPTGGNQDDAIALEPIQVLHDQVDSRDEDGTDLLLLSPSTDDPNQVEHRPEGVMLLVLPAVAAALG